MNGTTQVSIRRQAAAEHLRALAAAIKEGVNVAEVAQGWVPSMVAVGLHHQGHPSLFNVWLTARLAEALTNFYGVGDTAVSRSGELRDPLEDAR